MKLNGFFLILVNLIATSAFSSTKTYNMSLELGENGKTILSPRITATADEVAGITENFNTDEYTVDVVAHEVLNRSAASLARQKTKSKKVKLDLVVSRKSLLSGEEANGFSLKKSVVVTENVPAIVKLQSQDGRQLKLRVIAQEQVSAAQTE